MKRSAYEKPAITDERNFETQAMACGKIPGLGDQEFCDPVWGGKHGQHKEGCTMNDSSRSS